MDRLREPETGRCEPYVYVPDARCLIRHLCRTILAQMESLNTLTLSEKAKTELEQLGVVAVYLMGSRATGTATSRSDYDFGVVLDRGARATGDRSYPHLHQVLYALLADEVPSVDPPPPGMLRDVDVVFLQRAPLYYATHALRHGKLIHDRDPGTRVRFEQQVCETVMDFQPLRRELERGILARA